jgi:short-subunit dehydrogenase
VTGRFPLPFSGPLSASKAAMEAFADVYRTELKPFGVDFIMMQPGNMLTCGPAKTAAQLKQVSENMTVEQKIYTENILINSQQHLTKCKAPAYLPPKLPQG